MPQIPILSTFQDIFMLDFLKKLFDLQNFGPNFIQPYGELVYAILFFIIFAETGFVVTPFLPGDSLLFAVGAIAARPDGGLDLVTLIVVMSLAAIIGNTINYRIGYLIGPKIFERETRWIKKEHLIKTHAFYEKYGAMAIILSRFLPIFRTFVPFVAGIGQMDWKKYMFYNLVGGISWVVLGTVAGYMFGNIPFVQRHFELILIGIVVVTVMPAAVGVLREYLKAKKA